MPTDLEGTPTSLGIGTYNTSIDAPSGLGFNEAMAQIDALIAARVAKPSGVAAGDVPVWDGSNWVTPSGSRDGTKFLRDDGSWAAAGGGATAINSQTGTTYTPVLSDADNVVELSNASAISFSVPLNSSVPFPVGTAITLIQTGAGQVTVSGVGGVTVNGTPGLKLATQWAVATLLQRAADTWILLGNVSS